MATITEDYVSFETAKLLKEKGFDERLLTFYITDKTKKEGCFQIMAFTDDKIDNNHSDYCYLAPTIQMAIKWLREVHKLYINVCPCVEGYYWTEKWHSYVENLKKRYPFGRFICTFNSCEQACEAGIKYCLENLI